MFHHRKPFLMAALMAVAAASAQAQMPASGEASAQADGAARQKTASHDGVAASAHIIGAQTGFISPVNFCTFGLGSLLNARVEIGRAHV